MPKKIISFFILILMLSSSACSHKQESQDDNKITQQFEKEYTTFVKMINEVIKENEITARYAASYLTESKPKPIYSRSIYFKDSTGVLADHKHETKSNIYIPANTPITEKTWNVIQSTEKLEERWSKVYKNIPNIGWQYLTEKESMVTRTYPWLDEVRYLGPYIDYTKVPQWKLVEPKANPSGDSACTAVYFDHDGLGDMISCASPILNKGSFIGNMTTDLPLRSFFKPLNGIFNRTNKACLFAVGRKGKIIYGTSAITDLPLCNSLILNGQIDNESPLTDIISHTKQCDKYNKQVITFRKKGYRVFCKKIKYVGGIFIKIYENKL